MPSLGTGIDIRPIVSDLQSSKYAWSAAVALLIWDMLLTFDLEVERVWKTKGSLGRRLFFVNRYLSPMLFAVDFFSQTYARPSLDFCQYSFLPSNILGVLAIGVVELVLVWRTYALYQSKALLYGLLILAFASTATMITVTVYNYVEFLIWIPSGALPGVTGCLSDRTSVVVRTTLTVFWIPFFVLETLIVGLTFWKSWSSFTAGQGGIRTRFVKIIYRDGLIYYAVIMAISLVNLLLWVIAPIALSTVASALMRSLQVTIASRILLNIRGMEANPHEREAESTTIGVEGPLEFRSDGIELTVDIAGTDSEIRG